jgi:tetratricopeptide (TPR) repeat protein
MTDDRLRQELLDEGIKACKQARYAEAEKLLKSSLAQAEHFGELDLRLASSLNELGVLYRKTGKYSAAEDLLNRALAIRRQSAGLLHASTGESLNDGCTQNCARRLHQGESAASTSITNSSGCPWC